MSIQLTALPAQSEEIIDAEFECFIEVQPSRAAAEIGCSQRTFYDYLAKEGWLKIDLGGGRVAYRVPYSFYSRFNKPATEDKMAAIMSIMQETQDLIRTQFQGVHAAQRDILDRLTALEAKQTALQLTTTKPKKIFGLFPIK